MKNSNARTFELEPSVHWKNQRLIRTPESSRHSKVVVVVPAFNSEKTVGGVIERVPKQFVSEIIVVDDGSQDGTYDAALTQKVVVLKHPSNLGYGAAQKTLLKEALLRNASIVVLLHDDLQYPPEMVPEMAAPIMRGHADVVLGTRRGMLEGKMPFWRFVGNRFLTFIENLALGQHLTEYHTGYRAFSAHALNLLDLDSLSNDFNFDSQILFQTADRGLRVAEIPIPTVYGEGSSSIAPMNAIKYGIEIMVTVIKRLLFGHVLL